ncbi:9639_t:CDS:1 [Ambispora leptoticha]|uniref:9639_t:CDS:1 n=1 Tax=Ambispora leptoticha TaxID=144679 RepID=A0A9N9F6X6_9GLOM|nr:9639_t:CDS:1 [Ambispora leptoticha]
MSPITYHHFYQNSYIVKANSLSGYIDTSDNKFIRVVCEAINGVQSVIGYVTIDVDLNLKFVLNVLRKTNLVIVTDSDMIASVDYVQDIFLSSECEFYRQLVQYIKNYRKMFGNIPTQIPITLPCSSDDLNVFLAWLCDKDDLKLEAHLTSENLQSISEVAFYFRVDLIAFEVLKFALARFDVLEEIENMKKRMERMNAEADAEIEKDKKRLKGLTLRRESKNQWWLVEGIKEAK